MNASVEAESSATAIDARIDVELGRTKNRPRGVEARPRADVLDPALAVLLELAPPALLLLHCRHAR